MSMTKETVTITTPYIQLDQLLKLHGDIGTGGQIKPLLLAGAIMVNGEVCREKRKKLYPGDTVVIDNEITLVVEEA